MLEIPDHVWYSMSVLYGYVYAKKMYIYSYIICEKMYIYSYIIYVYIYIHTLKYVLLIETVYTHIISHLIWGQDWVAQNRSPQSPVWDKLTRRHALSASIFSMASKDSICARTILQTISKEMYRWFEVYHWRLHQNYIHLHPSSTSVIYIHHLHPSSTSIYVHRDHRDPFTQNSCRKSLGYPPLDPLPLTMDDLAVPLF